jgi:peptidoglycan LD-endopeptidase CwlK
MPIFSKESMVNLSTCHPDLQVLAYEVIKKFDCKCVCGHRGQEDQDKAFAEGKSKLKYPNGNHNAIPSNAMDLYPYPIDMKNTNRFYWFGGYVMGIAEMLYAEGKIDHRIRYGGDWDGDKDINDQTLNDLVHFEIIN